MKNETQYYKNVVVCS